MVKKITNYSFGFTLLEMLITIGVIGIISGLTFASFNFFSGKKQLQTDVRKFINVLELAREKARGNIIDKCPSGGVTLKYYVIEIVNSQEYKLYPVCLDKNGSQLNTPENNKLGFSLEKSSFSSFPLNVKFENGSGNLTPDLENEICINISIQGFITTSTQVCINHIGNIYEK